MTDTWNSRRKATNGSSNSSEKKNSVPCFPLINGEVAVVLNSGDVHVIKNIPGLFICNAGEQDGIKFHELCGQPFEYIVKNIWQRAADDEYEDARIATVKYLEEIHELVGESKENKYVQTIFGLKYLSWVKPAAPKPLGRIRF